MDVEPPVASTSTLVIPDGFVAHTENSSSILLPAPDSTTGQKEVFLNPAQEYNRDLSVVAIRAWSEIFADEDAERREKARAKKAANSSNKRQKTKHEASDANPATVINANTEADVAPAVAFSSAPTGPQDTANGAAPSPSQKPPDRKTFTCFEALAASGLRSIRYAKELPLLRWVIANDLSASAVKSIYEHVKLNGLSPPEGKEGKVRPQQGDCTDVMYAHRAERKRFDVVDLDPYGTAAPFLDAAVQSVSDGGLLCVTCTDMAVLAGAHYPEKAFSNYGGTAIKGDFTHEAALRLVLHAISACAVRYGRCITPMLSLSIDFYVRVFVRIRSSPAGSKRASTSTGTVYTCHGCAATHVQPLVKLVGQPGNEAFKTMTGPPMPSEKCEQCDLTFALGGPMWIGPLHDKGFVKRMLEHVNAEPAPTYKTLPRLKGMLAIAHSELDVPFYFTASSVAGHFHCTAPSMMQVGSALLHAGYDVSRSHAAPGSIKTTAPRSVVNDIMRAWVVENPVTMANIKSGSPARALLAKMATLTNVSFTMHDRLDEKMLTTVKLVRYQENPPGQGPISVAKGGKGRKRKHD